VRDLLVLSSF